MYNRIRRAELELKARLKNLERIRDTFLREGNQKAADRTQVRVEEVKAKLEAGK